MEALTFFNEKQEPRNVDRCSHLKHFNMFQVNSSSISEMAGMVAGDLLVAVNGEDVQTYRHKVSSSVRITLLTL